jgi:predicted phage terminase large subunit-like protein
MTGRLVKDMANNEDSDQYEVIEFPAILEVEDKDTGEIVQRALWPEFFDLTALLRTKASMPVFQWNAQYQQNPTGEEAAIIKRDWWRLWPDDDPPAVEYIIMALDAAAEANNPADFTSLTTWGVFFNHEEDMHQIILLNAIKQRMEFPELKAMSMEEYKEWEPDAFIVEKKSSGTALYQEMRRAGVMVQEYTPVRGSINNPNSKMARLNSVSDIISSGLVWIPAKRWAEELVEEVAGFPFASNDDQVDTTIMALMRFRQGGFIRLPTDERDEEIPYRRKVDYY